MTELRSQDTQCLYALVETDEVKTVKNVTFNLKITAKSHVCPQTLTKHLQIQKDQGKIVGGVWFTRYPVSM